ncbi:hypothetical protein MN01_00167 [Escherichia phage MN01]|nr:hypothetical protein MN01_00167 [Escherichia phage MN01]
MIGTLLISLWLLSAFGIGFMYWWDKRQTRKIVERAINRGFNR